MNQCMAPNSQGWCQLTYPCALGYCQYAAENVRVTTTDGTGMVVKVDPPRCPTCGNLYFSHPRMGISHKCTPDPTAGSPE